MSLSVNAAIFNSFDYNLSLTELMLQYLTALTNVSLTAVNAISNNIDLSIAKVTM